MTQNDFWAQLTNKAYWQVVLALIVAFATSYANNLFLRRRNKKRALEEAISDFHKYGYQLQQVVSNRLQCEAFVVFYAELSRLTKDTIYLELQKAEVIKMPELSMDVSRAYGDLYKVMATLEQLLKLPDRQKLKRHFDKIRNYKMLTIPDLSASTEEDATKYRDEMAKRISLWIHQNIKTNANAAYKILLFSNDKNFLKTRFKHGA